MLQYCSPPLTGQEQAGWAHLLETGLVTVELINSPLGLVLRWSFEIGELLGAVILSASLCRPVPCGLPLARVSGCIAMLLDLQLVTRRAP